MSSPDQAAYRVCSLKTNYFLGIATEVNENVHFVDENTLLYPIGRVFLFHNTQTDVQKYMKIPNTQKIITRIAMAPNRRLIAVAEYLQKPTISVFNLETRGRVIILGNPLSTVTSNTFEFVSFTCDSEYIVAVTGPPEWMLIYYKINGHVESYASAMGDVPPSSATNITKVECNPLDRTILCIAGFGLFRFVSWTDNQWIQYGFNSADKLQITDLCWVTDEIVIAGTKSGLLVVVEYGDVRGVYQANTVTEIHVEKGDHRVDIKSQNLPKGYKNGVYQIRGLTSFSTGFAYSYTRTMLVVFERTTPHTWLKKNVVYTVESSRILIANKHFDLIRNVAISPSGKKLACTTGRKEIYLTDILMEQDLSKNKCILCQKVLSGFHVGRVADVAVCRWKPLMISVGKDDGSCRIWNYKTKKLLFTQYYSDDKIYGCAFHPTGWYCLLGFKHQLKMFMIMVDELRSIRLFRIKMCSLVNFSRQGHMFAAGNTSKRTLEIYCCVSFEMLWSFKCYNDPMTAAHFGRNDNFVYSIDPDGSINFWDLQTGEDVNTKIYLDSANYQLTTGRNGAVYFVGADGIVKQIMNEHLRSYKLGQGALYAVALGDAEECFFVGGEKCSVISLEFPLMESLVSLEFKMHSWPIKKIIVTNNDSTLISLDSNGIIGFWRIRFPFDKRTPQFNTPQLGEVLVNVKKLAEEDETIEKQQMNIERKIYQHNYILQHLQDVKVKSLESLTKDYLNKIEGLKRNMKADEKFHSTQTSKFQQKFEELTKYYVNELEKQSKDFESDLLKEYLKTDGLKGQMMVFVSDVRKFLKVSKGSTEQVFDVYNSFINSKVKTIKTETVELERKKKSLLQKFSRETYYFEKFINDCIDQYNEYHTNRLTKLKKRKEYLKDEILFLIKKSSTLEVKINNFYTSGMTIFKNLDEMRIDSRTLKTKNKALQLTLEALEAQAKKKDELIIGIRKLLKSNVHEQMEKNERLENLKLVLKPLLESEVRKSRETVDNLSSNLKSQRLIVISISLCIGALERQIKEALKKKSQNVAYNVQIKKYLDDVKSDLTDANLVSDNRVELKKTLMSLYRKYINPKATMESIEENCGDAGLPVETIQTKRAIDAEKTGLEDVIEFYQMEEMLKKGEKSLSDVINTMRKALPSRPRLIVGQKFKTVTPPRNITILKEINSYRYKIAEALKKLANEDRCASCSCRLCL